MIIEAICFVAGAVPPTVVAIELWRQREQWHKNADEALALSRKAIGARDKAFEKRDQLLARIDRTADLRAATIARNRALLSENADLRAKLEALQSQTCALPKRDAAGRFVAREVQA